jgi:hypothetical protein
VSRTEDDRTAHPKAPRQQDRAGRRQFLQQLGALAAAPALTSAAHAEGRVNPPAIFALEGGNYRYVPAGSVFCAGVLPDEGYEVVHAILRPRLPLAMGYAFIENYLKNLERPIQALCGMELQAPAQMTFDAFRAFNAPYVAQLDKWGLIGGRYSAVCRTNVVPAIDAPSEAVVHAFSYVAPAIGNSVTFCVSGTADIDQRGKVVAEGETSAAAMKKKLEFVLGVIGNRLAEMELDWSSATHVDLYLAADIPGLWGSTILPAIGAAGASGVRLHHARPPIVGAEVELEARGLAQELVLRTG